MYNGMGYLTSLGYGVEDYIMMFDLTEAELDRTILDCHPGASVFSEEMASSRHNVLATDPLYQKPVEEIRQAVVKGQANLIQAVEQHPEQYHYGVLELKEKLELREVRIERFLADIPKGVASGRYHTDGLPNLSSFQAESFDLALMHHYLFTETFDVNFHLQCILEMTRVSNEVRIFPLVDRKGELSPFIGDIVATLQAKGLGAELRGVPFCFQKKGNAMLRVWNESCTVKK
jgi:hypothetical protein